MLTTALELIEACTDSSKAIQPIKLQYLESLGMRQPRGRSPAGTTCAKMVCAVENTHSNYNWL